MPKIPYFCTEKFGERCKFALTSMMTFQHLPSPVVLSFLVIIAVLYVAYVLRIMFLAISLKTGFRSVFIKLITRSVYISLVVLALMAPSFGDIKKEIRAIGKDIFVLIDLSQSMNVRDVQPSRLEKVKFELKRIIDAFSSDRIGLIIFSSDAFVQCPLTYDISALNLFVETLHTGLVPNTGTDFAPALEIALKRFASTETSAQNPKSKIILLISDGEDFGEETEHLVEECEQQGIKLFTLGVGTEQGGKIPVENGFKRDSKGQWAISKLNADALRKFANITGATFYKITESQNDVSRLINDINKIEGELREVKTIDASANKYFYFLAVGFIFMILDVLITVKTMRI